MGTSIMGMGVGMDMAATTTPAAVLLRRPFKNRRRANVLCGAAGVGVGVGGRVRCGLSFNGQKRRGHGRSTWSCKAVEVEPTPNELPSSGVIYQGVYGPWSIDSFDVREVVLYRSGLVAAAASFVVASSTAFLPDGFWLRDLLDPALDFLYFFGAAGLGLSLYLIHIYVTEIKRTFQAFWLLGVSGSLATYFALAQPADMGLVHYVVQHPTAVWLIGPLFASLTGLVIKEGLCYGKLEAALLAFIIPASLLGHLTGTMDNGVKTFLLGVWVIFFAIFSGRKFTQPIKDDIGDKSVFMFNALPEEEKAARLEKARNQKI